MNLQITLAQREAEYLAMLDSLADTKLAKMRLYERVYKPKYKLQKHW
jgi:hypothetical protein